MYAPGHFAESDPTVLADAARRIGVGQLITSGSVGPEASFIPLLVADDAGTVTGHLARANGQWSRADLAVPALVTWVGPDAYVSPNYYPSTREHGKVVPTWNLITVQARGVLRVHHDAAWKRAHVASLTRFHEGALPVPWSVDDAPSDYIDGRLEAIVGVELTVTSIEGQWKLSQNRSEPDVAGVIAALGSQGPGPAAALAHEMELAMVGRATAVQATDGSTGPSQDHRARATPVGTSSADAGWADIDPVAQRK
jgi:transcriptional regulator